METPSVPLSPAEPIKASQYRTKKEVVYFIFVVLVSVAVWAGLGFYIYTTAQEAMKPQPAKVECFVKDPEYGQVYLTDPSELYEGQKCEDPKTLSPEEMEQARKTQELIDTLSGKKTGADRWEDIALVVGLVISFYLFTFFLHLFALAYIRMNSVKVGSEQLSKIWNTVLRQSARLGLKKQPATYVLNGQGTMNAFAAKLVRKKVVVLYSDLVEALVEADDQTQLDVVIGHELGHHALGHTCHWMWLLLPGEFFPLLSGAWSREREYSSDRVALALTGNLPSCERAIIKLAAGRLVGRSANVDKFVDQVREERSFFTWLAEISATHPHLPKRVIAVRKLASQGSPSNMPQNPRHNFATQNQGGQATPPPANLSANQSNQQNTPSDIQKIFRI
ncbi:M48 family metallopeptidase [Candidatus Uhrbacteria bacterium]|nr:M48 family metallopeptidase [Candidatus Uhrbacteria bacterium]